MGNNKSEITQADLRRDWKVYDAGEQTIWENRTNPEEKLVQLRFKDSKFDYSDALRRLRRTCPYLVKGIFVKSEGASCQMDHQSQKVLVELIDLRISNVEDIPYPDVLHLYHVCINGYMQLAEQVGYFSIDEDQIGINSKGEVKVWLNNNFESERVGGLKISENQMVKQLLKILSEKIDHRETRGYPSIDQFIHAEDISFRMAHDRCHSYMREFNQHKAPEYLHCVRERGTGYIRQIIRQQGEQQGGQEFVVREGVDRTVVTRQQGQRERDVIVKEIIPQPAPVRVIETRNEPVQYSQVINGPPRQVERVSAPGEERIISEKVIETRRVQQPIIVRSPEVRSQIKFVTPTTTSQWNPPRSEVPVYREAPRQTVIRSEIPVYREAPRETVVRSEVPVYREAPRQTVIRSEVQASAVRRDTANIRFVSNPAPQAPQFSQPLNYQRANSINAPRIEDRPVATRIEERPRVVQVERREQVITTGPRVDYYSRPEERTTTSNIIDNLQGQTYNESKGDSVVASVPSSYGDNKLQQQRVISQTYSIKEESRENGYNGYDGYDARAREDNNWNYSKPSYEEKKVETYEASNSRFSPTEDGKSSPEFLAFLNEMKSGSGSYSGSGGYAAGSSYQVDNGTRLTGNEIYSHESISGGYGQTNEGTYYTSS